ncbi:MAG: hypothetical protein OXI53_04340 [Nitrospira sp.]|nr:hypothetical protein [Nitrospira sp.]MDE0404519.1 hypothetical protein [Nitrospira sp.]MDE0486263.1 hypothetical protein [Nitrospira sp.]
MNIQPVATNGFIARRDSPPGRRHQARTAVMLASVLWCMGLPWSGCASPVAMHRAVLEYDWTVNRIETELLLLNIARTRYHEPIHFTAVSNIAATFDFRVNSGLTGLLAGAPGADSLSLTLGSSAAENPTVTIIPIQGKEFTTRLLTPITEEAILFLGQQGIDPSILFRLVSRGIILEDNDGRQRFLLNQPQRQEGYREFRQRVMHLSWLQSERHLFINRLQFTDGDQRKTGRIVMTNYDPNMLSNNERLALHRQAERFPRNHILVNIRPDHPGGNFPMFGEIKLRSFKTILRFIGQGITEEPEFHVDPDPRTGPVAVNPARTLTIRESRTQPEGAIISAQKRGLWYYIDQESAEGEAFDLWNHEAFDLLYQLYHLTVTDISQIPSLPIAISK